jgi:3'-phosphoadenosine 5'-phosphosulfate sulfotransferase (PAPS reductase)/FAD synthetase
MAGSTTTANAGQDLLNPKEAKIAVGKPRSLHPTVLPVATRFFARFGQHERSMFGFLLSTEPFALQSFASRPADAAAWYQLSDFYDYVRAMFGHKLAGASYRNHWLRITETIDRAVELPPLAQKVLKVVGVLNLLDADDQMATDIRAATATLTAGRLLFRRGRSGGYRLWPHSSVDLEAALQDAARSVGALECVSDHLIPYLNAEPVLARRHYLESGTMRYFEVRHARIDRLARAIEKPTDADGLLVIALPDTDADAEAAVSILSGAPFADRPDVVAVVPGPLSELGTELRDLVLWRWVTDNVPELADDVYAMAEVHRQTSAARRALSAKIMQMIPLRGSNSSLETQWYLEGKPIDVPANGRASAPLSLVCDRLYPKAPLIANELLNRNTLMLPSNHRRWCTRMLKLKPFENYIGDGPVINYVGLRADENRTGYISTKSNITAVYPFQEDGLVRADIIRILEDSGLGLPPYMAWGRSRSGCYFCFYQQKIEWVRLKEQHPDLFERAKEYEERSLGFGEQFYWMQSESLAELERPERLEQIKRNWEASEARKKAKRKNLSLAETLGGLVPDDDSHLRDSCLVCSL